MKIGLLTDFAILHSNPKGSPVDSPVCARAPQNEPRPGSVTRLLETLDAELLILEKSTETLTTSLAHVLEDCPVSQTEPDSAEPSPTCAIACTLVGLWRRAKGVRWQIEDVTERLRLT